MKIPKKISEAIASNQLVIFAGSGLSVKFGLPNWSTMVKDVIEQVDNENYNSLLPVLEKGVMSPIDILEFIKPTHSEIKGYIKNNFQLKRVESLDINLHKKLLDLTSQIVTTNYDNAFELASNNSIIPAIYTSDYNISEINKNEESYIFKLHGSYSEPDHCIVFKHQYEDLYSKDTAAKEKLKTIFAEKTILFLGFSFNDPDINLIFNNLDVTFGQNTKHYIITKDARDFKDINFLESIEINDYDEVDLFVEECIKIKQSRPKHILKPIKEEKTRPKIAILIPNPIDIDFNGELDKLVGCFNSVDCEISLGVLNIKTLENIEDFDLIIIASKVFKSKLYIENDNLKYDLLSPSDICMHITNDEIPVVFITDDNIDSVPNYPTINISSLKNAIIKKFIFKTLKEGKIDFKEDEISVHLNNFPIRKFQKGVSSISSIYNNNRDLDIGKKCINDVVGRVEEQSIIATKLLAIYTSNKLLNIKASGGTGKTTLIKKVSYELYNRGYYREGVNFKSCENVKTFEDFEEILLNGFNLMNILDFKDYLINNYSYSKINLLVILDNFETVVNNLNKEDLNKTIELLKFVTDYSSLVVTSREKISFSDDFEDMYSLTPMTTDDAFELFQNCYGKITDNAEIRILREDILEDLLNNNPLAIKLVTKSRTKLTHISQLRDQLKNHFFESINMDYSLVFKSNADLNIERTKSIFQSINYSYTTLNLKEKIAFELLSLFPDGISLSNFKKCFAKASSDNNISDRELRVLRDKSLVEDYNGNLQLQPIIRRFSDFQFMNRPNSIRQKYCSDAYRFNCFILDLIDYIQKGETISEALKLYNFYKNNLLKVLDYIPDIEISKKSLIPEKKYLLNYIFKLDDYIVSEKQIREYNSKLDKIKEYFTDLTNAEILIDVLKQNKFYYFKEFDNSYVQLNKLLPTEEMENRVFKNEDYIEELYKNIVSNIHSMEGYTMQRINSFILNNDYSEYLDPHFFYLGIDNSISRKKDGFYYFEYELMFNRLDKNKLVVYIDSLHSEQNLEIMQATYTLSKTSAVSIKSIQKLVITNPYTKGLKSLMFAFAADEENEKTSYFEEALFNLSHIKYYYLEALYYYCLYLEKTNKVEFHLKLEEGLKLSKQFYYQYLNFQFRNLSEGSADNYDCKYSFYSNSELEQYIIGHNTKWENIFKERELEKQAFS